MNKVKKLILMGVIIGIMLAIGIPALVVTNTSQEDENILQDENLLENAIQHEIMHEIKHEIVETLQGILPPGENFVLGYIIEHTAEDITQDIVGTGHSHGHSHGHEHGDPMDAFTSQVSNWRIWLIFGIVLVGGIAIYIYFKGRD